MSKVIVTPQFIDLEAPAVTRAMLGYILSQADIVGQDRRGCPVLRFEFACEPWLIDKLAAFDAGGEDIEDGDPAEEGSDFLVRPTEATCWTLATSLPSLMAKCDFCHQ